MRGNRPTSWLLALALGGGTTSSLACGDSGTVAGTAGSGNSAGSGAGARGGTGGTGAGTTDGGGGAVACTVISVDALRADNATQFVGETVLGGPDPDVFVLEVVQGLTGVSFAQHPRRRCRL